MVTHGTRHNHALVSLKLFVMARFIAIIFYTKKWKKSYFQKRIVWVAIAFLVVPAFFS
jgi:hypothetical protein